MKFRYQVSIEEMDKLARCVIERCGIEWMIGSNEDNTPFNLAMDNFMEALTQHLAEFKEPDDEPLYGFWIKDNQMQLVWATQLAKGVRDAIFACMHGEPTEDQKGGLEDLWNKIASYADGILKSR